MKKHIPASQAMRRTLRRIGLSATFAATMVVWAVAPGTAQAQGGGDGAIVLNCQEMFDALPPGDRASGTIVHAPSGNSKYGCIIQQSESSPVADGATVLNCQELYHPPGPGYRASGTVVHTPSGNSKYGCIIHQTEPSPISRG